MDMTRIEDIFYMFLTILNPDVHYMYRKNLPTQGKGKYKEIYEDAYKEYGDINKTIDVNSYES